MTTKPSIREAIVDTILANIPKEAEVTRVEFEGPKIAIYTKHPEILIEQNYIISDIVNFLRKRVVLRSDPSVRAPEPQVRAHIEKIVPKEAGIVNIFFDPAMGEVIIEAEKPALVIGKGWSNTQTLVKETKWMVRVVRAPTIPSATISFLRNFLYKKADERKRFLQSVGERIFRPPIFKRKEVRITALGGGMQVGRSCFLLQTGESSILLDCGINPGKTSMTEAFPRLDVNEFRLDELDAVIITHSHLDHCGALPLLYKYGYEGPVYCSEPTLSLMTILQMDYLDVLRSQGKPLPYSKHDVKKVITHTITLPEGIVTDISPDVKITLHKSSHILGSSIVHLHIGEGLHNIVYTGDFKYARTEIFKPAVTSFPRVETLITEATYGGVEDVMPPRYEAENMLVNIINETLNKGGKVIIPVLAVGRSQEIMLLLDRKIRDGSLKEVPIFIEGMISEVTSIHTAYPEYFSKELSTMILHQGVDPFKSDYFVTVKHPSERANIIDGEPSVILATSGMLEGGPVLTYFRELAPDSRNTVIFVSYQISGTLGSRVQKGLREVEMLNPETGKMEIIKVNARIETVEGFSGHSDRNQLIEYLKRVTPTPKRFIICHGERSKCLELGAAIRKMFRVDVKVPNNLESIRLC